MFKPRLYASIVSKSGCEQYAQFGSDLYASGVPEPIGCNESGCASTCLALCDRLPSTMLRSLRSYNAAWFRLESYGSVFRKHRTQLGLETMFDH